MFSVETLHFIFYFSVKPESDQTIGIQMKNHTVIQLKSVRPESYKNMLTIGRQFPTVALLPPRSSPKE